MFFGSPEHLTFLRYEVLSPQRRYGDKNHGVCILCLPASGRAETAEVWEEAIEPWTCATRSRGHVGSSQVQPQYTEAKQHDFNKKQVSYRMISLGASWHEVSGGIEQTWAKWHSNYSS